MLKYSKKVLTFGTFDVFHKGHISYLKQAKKFGDFLVCVVARDKNVKKIKRKLPQNNEKKRLLKVKESQISDRTILGNPGNKYKVIKQQKPQIICLGYDQKIEMSELKKYLLKFNLENVRIERLKSFRPEIYKSSKLK